MTEGNIYNWQVVEYTIRVKMDRDEAPPTDMVDAIIQDAISDVRELNEPTEVEATVTEPIAFFDEGGR